MHVPCANPFKRTKCTSEGDYFLEDVDDPPPKIQRLAEVQMQTKYKQLEKIDKAFQRMSSFESKVICIYD